MAEPGMPSRWRRWSLNAFIVLHVYVIAAWGLPESQLRAVLVSPIENYVNFWGLWHSWDMFAPAPLSLNFRIEAIIQYQDGSTRTWNFPEMAKLSLWERYQKERYRKWAERVRLDSSSAIWDDTCRFVARLNDTPTNHPTRVILIRHWEQIPPPAVVPGTVIPEDYQSRPDDYAMPFNYRFKSYDVRPADL
jgi:hypothetical protein